MQETDIHTPLTNAKSSAIGVYPSGTVDPLNPDPADITIEAIAHSLAMQCRFTGHTRYHYSVAQHSVACSELAPDKWALWALMHDAPEMMMSDIARPIKRSSTEFGNIYNAIEDKLMEAVCIRFGLELIDGGLPKVIGEIDELVLANEMVLLMPDDPIFDLWKGYPSIPTKLLRKMQPEEAEELFLYRYTELGGSYA